MVETHGTITLGRPGRSVDLGGLRLVEASYEPGRVLAAHAHRSGNVTLVLEGDFEERLGGAMEVAGPASLVVKPGGTVHSDRYGARPVRAFVIEVDPAREGELGLVGAPARWFHGGPSVGCMLDLLAAFQERSSDLEARTLDRLGEIVARGRLEPPPAGVGTRSGRTLARALALLRDGATRQLGSSELARRVGAHPVYLARLFRAAHGCGIAAYRRRLQVREAARRLSETRASLSDVAAGVGFADQSHLCRGFKAELGLTPGAYRRVVTARGGPGDDGR